MQRQLETTTAVAAANAELRQQRDLLDSFINSLPGVVYVVDPQKRLLRWNRRFEEVTGRTAAEPKNFDSRQLFPASEAPVLQAGKTVETHRAQWMARLEIYDVAGLVRYALRVGLISTE